MRLLIGFALFAGCEKQEPAPLPQVAPITRDAASVNREPDECAEYQRVIGALARCEKMPEPSRDALEKAFQALQQSWTTPDSRGAEARNKLALHCKQGTDALVQAAGTMCDLKMFRDAEAD